MSVVTGLSCEKHDTNCSSMYDFGPINVPFIRLSFLDIYHTKAQVLTEKFIVYPLSNNANFNSSYS